MKIIKSHPGSPWVKFSTVEPGEVIYSEGERYYMKFENSNLGTSCNAINVDDGSLVRFNYDTEVLLLSQAEFYPHGATRKVGVHACGFIEGPGPDPR